MIRTPDRSPGWQDLTIALAAVAAVAAGIRREIAVPGLTPGLLVAVVLTPLWLPHVLRIAQVRWVLAVMVGAIGWGVVLVFSQEGNDFSRYNQTFQIMTILALVVTGCLLMWVQRILGVPWTVFLFGVGAVVHVVINGANPVNPWKYSWSLPVTILLLGVAMLLGARLLEIVVLIVIAGVSATSDSRSMTAFVMLAAALVTWQVARGTGGSMNRGALVGALAVGALGGYNLFQELLLAGVLGQSAAERTQTQLDATGSLLTGGRPELGASRALLEARPQGFGPGAIPTANDVWVAKSGMSTLNYDPNNGYVEVFMFGGRFEVHSMIGDFWIWLGPLGAVLIVLLLVAAVRALIDALAANRASAVLCLMTILGLWNAAFSPVQTSFHLMSLMWALAVVSLTRPRASSARHPVGVEVEACRGNGRD